MYLTQRHRYTEFLFIIVLFLIFSRKLLCEAAIAPRSGMTTAFAELKA